MTMTLNRRTLLTGGASLLVPGVAAAGAGISSAVTTLNPALAPYQTVWSDTFKTLSLRTGGPTRAGFKAGKGTWTPARRWWEDGRGTAGFAYDWFVNPNYAWPASYRATHPTGQFSLTSQGLRIRSEAPTPEMTAILGNSSLNGAPLWLSGILESFDGVHIKPPFYFEMVAQGTPKTGFPAAWLTQYPYPIVGTSMEIDVFEEFGILNFIYPVMHQWNVVTGKQVGGQTVIGSKSSGFDLSAGMNTWGCWVQPTSVTVFFNNVQLGRGMIPTGANMANPFGIILNSGAGIPWNKMVPANGPLDFTINRVTFYAPDSSGLTLG